MDIVRPTNGVVLKRFPDSIFRCHSYYRLSEDAYISVQEGYAWCKRCEDFVKAEILYTLDEIERNIAERAGRNHVSPEGELQSARAWHNLAGIPIRPPHVFFAHTYHAWKTAYSWRKNRRTGGKCLECGSCFSITILPEGEDVPHPGGDGMIRVGGGSIDLGGGPPLYSDYAYFDGEGIRVAEGREYH